MSLIVNRYTGEAIVDVTTLQKRAAAQLVPLELVSAMFTSGSYDALNLQNVTFVDCLFTEASFSNCTFSLARFLSSEVQGVTFLESDFTCSSTVQSKMSCVTFSGCQLGGISWHGQMSSVQFDKCVRDRWSLISGDGMRKLEAESTLDTAASLTHPHHLVAAVANIRATQRCANDLVEFAFRLHHNATVDKGVVEALQRLSGEVSQVALAEEGRLLIAGSEDSTNGM